MELLIPAGVMLFIATNHLVCHKQNKQRKLAIDDVKTSLSNETPHPIEDVEYQEDEGTSNNNANVITNRRFKPIIYNAPIANGDKEWIGESLTRQVIEDYYGYPFPKLKNFVRNPKTGYYLELDGYCKELKIAFEYQGEQHYDYPSKWITSKEKFKEQIWRDGVKKKACEHCGIFLVVIPYTFRKVKGKNTYVSNEEFFARVRQHLNLLESKRKSQL